LISQSTSSNDFVFVACRFNALHYKQPFICCITKYYVVRRVSVVSVIKLVADNAD